MLRTGGGSDSTAVDVFRVSFSQILAHHAVFVGAVFADALTRSGSCGIDSGAPVTEWMAAGSKAPGKDEVARAASAIRPSSSPGLGAASPSRLPGIVEYREARPPGRRAKVKDARFPISGCSFSVSRVAASSTVTDSAAAHSPAAPLVLSVGPWAISVAAFSATWRSRPSPIRIDGTAPRPGSRTRSHRSPSVRQVLLTM